MVQKLRQTGQKEARQMMQRCETLAQFSEDKHSLTRRSFSPQMQQANEQVTSWMRQAGMVVTQDVIGNLIGRYPAERPTAPTLLLGSHLDTIRNAGKYDGTLGVVVALACVQRFAERRQRLPFHIEVIAFADEEGLRYHTAYLGSMALAGTFDTRLLQRVDGKGIRMADAIRTFGGNPDMLDLARKDPLDLLGYCEVHIEQGPVLEANNLPVGVVTAIAGQTRLGLTLTGRAGHAGTVPMDLRADALCAAAEVVLTVERVAREREGLVATVGHLYAQPGVSNVISGQVDLSIDIRHRDDTQRLAARAWLQEDVQEIAAQRGLAVTWRAVHENAATPCAPVLQDRLQQAVESVGLPAFALPSGAGHDAVAMARLIDMGMLFVRCKGGVSHHPDESVLADDTGVALDVLEQFVLGFAA